MTDLLTPEDTGDIAETQVLVYPQPYLSVVDTHVIDFDARQALQHLWADAISARRPVATIRPVDTGELPIWPTGAEVVAALPHEPERPDRYRGRRRAADPPWAWALIGAGTLLAAQAAAFVGTVLLNGAIR